MGLANVAFAAGDIGAARERYEQALRIDPGLREAHEGLSYVLSREGDEAGAERHRAIAFEGRWLRTRPFAGAAAPIPVLLLLSGKGGNVFTDFLLDERSFLVHELIVDYAPQGAKLPEHAFVFNAIADADRAGFALEQASKIVCGDSARVINDPRIVARTTRARNAKRFAEIEGVRTARILPLDRCSSPPFEFPFLLRVPGHHTGRYFVSVDNVAQYEAALRDLPGNDLLAMEKVDTRSADGYVRKYRVMIVAGALYPVHLAISREWKVHYMNSATAGNAQFEREEEQFLEAPETAIGGTAMETLRRVAAELALDYGGIDFGITPDGQVAVFEANAQMILLPPQADSYAQLHRESATRVFEAARAMLVDAVRGQC